MANFFNGGDVIQDKSAKSLSFYFAKNVARIDREIVKQLVEESARKGNCNGRICLHTSPTANFHEMIILERKGQYYRPHKHLYKGESCHIIEGKAAMFVFNDNGSVVHCCVVGEDENLICRVGINQWHTVIPTTEYAVYHESKPGPYLGEGDSIKPDWAPDGSDRNEATAYMEQLSTLARRGSF